MSFTEFRLQVAANTKPRCKFHTKNGGQCPNKLCVWCEFNDGTFGRADGFTAGPEGLGLYRSDNNEGTEIVWMRHYALRFGLPRTYFALDIDDQCAAQDFPQYNACSSAAPLSDDALAAREAIRVAAIANLENIFDNRGNPEPLPIEFRFANEVPDSPPSDYPTQAPMIPAFTLVYGKDEWSQVGGRGRRRTGTSNRDFTVFTLNWMGGSRVAPGETYVNKQFFFSSTLGDVDAKANTLLPEVEIAKISSNEYQPRRVDLYQLGTSFTAVAAPSSQGDTTSCRSSSANLVCSGKSTPTPGYLAYFYVSCGSSSYFGTDPYSLSPGSGSVFTFPGSSQAFSSNTTTTSYANNPIRAYVCDGQPSSGPTIVRPSWKLLGFFDPSTCNTLADATYDDDVCIEQPSTSPSESSVPSLQVSCWHVSYLHFIVCVIHIYSHVIIFSFP